jgi:hypothetical protein
MRKFYIFKINKEFNILNKDDSYNIYRQMENIKNLDKDNFYNAIKIYETLANTFNKSLLDIEIYNKHKYSYYYTKYKNVHMINNYYRNEESKLIINKAYLLLETNIIKPAFFKDLKNKGLFVCDFENKDYFWVDNLYST